MYHLIAHKILYLSIVTAYSKVFYQKNRKKKLFFVIAIYQHKTLHQRCHFIKKNE